MKIDSERPRTALDNRACCIIVNVYFVLHDLKEVGQMDGSQKERNDLLEAYETLRVADVRDGLDWNMAHHWGTVDTAIRPLYRTRICGIARTARYVPYEGPIPKLTPEEYTEWSDWYYRAVCTFDFINEIEDGDVIMIDQSSLDVGLIGSNSGLAGFVKGARGYVTNGGVRDTDELILRKGAFLVKNMCPAHGPRALEV